MSFYIPKNQLISFVHQVSLRLEQQQLNTARLAAAIHISHTNLRALMNHRYRGDLLNEYVYKIANHLGIPLELNTYNYLNRFFGEPQVVKPTDPEMALVALYPHYYKDISSLNVLDVYRVCDLYQVDDTSGSIHHAIKKLLVSGNRGGGKSFYKDVKEARDTLDRYLTLNASVVDDPQPSDPEPEDFVDTYSAYAEEEFSDTSEQSIELKQFTYNPPIAGWDNNDDNYPTLY